MFFHPFPPPSVGKEMSLSGSSSDISFRFLMSLAFGIPPYLPDTFSRYSVFKVRTADKMDPFKSFFKILSIC